MKAHRVWASAALLLLAAAGWLLPLKPWLGAALTWAAAHREPSALAFVALYVLASVCLVPGLILTLAGGVRTGRAGTVLLVVGLAATVTVAALVTRVARRRLEQELAP